MDARLLVPALVAVGVLLPLQATPALACSCAGPGSHAESAARADVVVSGEVLERRAPSRRADWSSGEQAVYVVQVRRVHQGGATSVLEVRTAGSGVSCGLELPGSGPVLLYAERSDDGTLHAGLCGGSRTAGNAEAVAIAGEGVPPSDDDPGDGADGAGAPATSGSGPRAGAVAGLLLVAVGVGWVAAGRRRRSARRALSP